MLVQKLRLQRGWSQEQLAELSGLSVRTIQRIERGLPASNETLKSLASVFEIDFSTLQATQEPVMTTTLNPNMNNSMPSSQPSTDQSVSADEEAALRHVRKIRGFYVHLAQYVIVIGALAIFNFIKSPNHIWVIWPALGWGLGLVFHGMRIFGTMPFMNPDWEKRQVEKYLGRKL
ncbi:MAG TPA: helix-turn-helix domain-containing protein [Burkholderiaceae bacterium]|nr:helix-turn-helix domain-containing protein [Burkholderiaceae bacterium]